MDKIIISRSKTADTRSCDYSKVSKETLIASSKSHISDVRRGIALMARMMQDQAERHDADKLSNIDQFHADFLTGFKSTTWWDAHRKINRHHINAPDGVREDVNLIDVLEHIVDCVMAGKARTGTVYQIKLPPELLEQAFLNTFEMMVECVEVSDSGVEKTEAKA